MLNRKIKNEIIWIIANNNPNSRQYVSINFLITPKYSSPLTPM